MEPLISVAIATFNGERFVEEQLASILRQRPVPYEVVIADDGSSDRTRELVASATSAASFRTRTVGGDHVGLRRNVERAIEECEGSVIVLCDQDDIWLPGRLEAIARAFEDPSVTLWLSDAELIDEHGVTLNARLWESVHLTSDARHSMAQGGEIRRLLHGMTVTGATMAFRASVRTLALPLPIELEGPDHLFLHDGWIAVLAALTGRVVIDERVFTRYRQHGEQFTGMRVTEQSPSSARRAPVSHRAIAEEHARVSLVLERLAQRGALARLTPASRRLLTELEELLRRRGAPPGMGRARAILSALRTGQYDRYARGWRTALADLIYPRR